MNAINVVPKTVTVIPAKTLDVAAVTWRTLDDSFNRKLRIQVNNAISIVVEGADYDALGQWTDDTIKGVILARMNLTEAA